MYRIEVVDEPACPVTEYIGYRHVVGDTEGEIQVRVAVSAIHGERAHFGSGQDALILIGHESEHVLAEIIPLLNREHSAKATATSWSFLGWRL